jgi:hypothetical protein
MSDFQQPLPITAAPVRAPERLVEFDAETHTYFVDGEPWQHVTGILKAAGVVDDAWFTEYGRWRGSATHRATHLLDEKRLEKRSLDEAIKPRVAAWQLFKEKTKFEPAMIEQVVWCDTHQFCGTLDRTGRFIGAEPGSATPIIDMKNYPPPDWVAIQLAAYGWALDPTQVFRRIAVELKADGTYSLREFPLQQYLDDVNTFLAMVSVARWKQRHA